MHFVSGGKNGNSFTQMLYHSAIISRRVFLAALQNSAPNCRVPYMNRDCTVLTFTIAASHTWNIVGCMLMAIVALQKHYHYSKLTGLFRIKPSSAVDLKKSTLPRITIAEASFNYLNRFFRLFQVKRNHISIIILNKKRVREKIQKTNKSFYWHLNKCRPTMRILVQITLFEYMGVNSNEKETFSIR